jgi:nucleotide-binding universal stress UspA family protein
LLPRADLEEELQQRQRAELERQLSKWGRRVGCTSVDTVVESGNPALSIIDRVLVKGHDLVVVTTDEDREDRATIRTLLRKCPCPVWVIRPTRARTQRVLAALNPDPDEADLNRLIIELAASMIELNGGELHVVHAWELFGESTLRSSAFVHASSAQIDEMLRLEYEARQGALDELLSNSTVAEAPWRIHLEKGPATDIVPRLAALLRINVLVMGTVARTGVRGLVMGNTAETILDQVHCSVVAVKPPEFVSPIELPSPSNRP